MLLYKQLDFFVSLIGRALERDAPSSRGETRADRAARSRTNGRDAALEATARDLLHSLGESALASAVRVEWSSRLRTAAGRADFRHGLITLNPGLLEHGAAEVDRTLRHELAHLLAHRRRGRRRIAPHGPEWRKACRDLGIADEQRCHTLPFPVRKRVVRFLYRCPRCQQDFPRVRRVPRAMACLPCCRRHNRGRFDRRFQLELIRRA